MRDKIKHRNTLFIDLKQNFGILQVKLQIYMITNGILTVFMINTIVLIKLTTMIEQKVFNKCIWERKLLIAQIKNEHQKFLSCTSYITSSQRKSDNSNNNGPRRNEMEDSMRRTTNARQCLDVGEGMLKLFYRFGGQDWPIYQVSSKSIQTQKLT